MAEQGRIRVEPTNRRIRAMIDGHVAVDTIAALLVWEIPYYPTFYLPVADVDMELFVASGATDRSPSRGTATLFDLEFGDRVVEGAAYSYPDPAIAELADHISIRWGAMDHWFEEDEEVFVHARDPYTRVDILRSSRHVRVEIDGVTVADSSSGSFLYETGLPTRYYLPKTDVDFSLLTPTSTTTSCPYKGTARYWSATVNGQTFEDIVWGYDAPLPESQEVVGLVCFYNEKVDIYLDGRPQDRPETKFG